MTSSWGKWLVRVELTPSQPSKTLHSDYEVKSLEVFIPSSYTPPVLRGVGGSQTTRSSSCHLAIAQLNAFALLHMLGPAPALLLPPPTLFQSSLTSVKLHSNQPNKKRILYNRPIRYSKNLKAIRSDGVIVSMQKLLRGGHGFKSDMEHCFI